MTPEELAQAAADYTEENDFDRAAKHTQLAPLTTGNYSTMSIIEKARLFAIKAHGDQKYGDHPYVKHLDDVVGVLTRYETEDLVIAAGYLHDTIEDTDTMFDDIFNEFGRHVARWVWAVSSLQGRNRKEKIEYTYPKILAGGREVMAIKLADRIANVTHSKLHNHGMLEMYQGEYDYFKSFLCIPGELKEMWAELDVIMQHKIEEKK